MTIMNRTERIKAGFVGKTKIIDPETGKERILDFDDLENVGIQSSEELRLIYQNRIKSKQKTFSEEELKKIHTPGDEFEDLEFLRKYDNL